MAGHLLNNALAGYLPQVRVGRGQALLSHSNLGNIKGLIVPAVVVETALPFPKVLLCLADCSASRCVINAVEHELSLPGENFVL
jgi:hypothetical protein